MSFVYNLPSPETSQLSTGALPSRPTIVPNAAYPTDVSSPRRGVRQVRRGKRATNDPRAGHLTDKRRAPYRASWMFRHPCHCEVWVDKCACHLGSKNTRRVQHRFAIVSVFTGHGCAFDARGEGRKVVEHWDDPFPATRPLHLPSLPSLSSIDP